MTSFLGRERELADVQERLQAARLLTLVGAGGNGKTRLALAVMEHYTDGVWFVELAPLSDASLVPNQLASVLGVREGPGEPIMTAVLRTLKERHLLLLLDNCEHLVLACAELADALLLGCPAVHILATSREGLGIAGEAVWRVPPLDQLSAERLFVERAAAASSSFGVTERNAVAITDVCARLDGTPLAIELAAARVALLSVEQIRGRLDNALGLLTTGGRLTAARQQSLRATLDWSYGLLLETEQQLFERLSVFAGGWALEAAEAVCADHNIKHADVLDLLAGLVAKSLVVSERHDDGPFRYRLLEPIRQYAYEQLDEPGRTDGIRQQHAEFFLRLAEGVQLDLLGHGATAALDMLELEQDNLRSALRWLLEHSQAERAQRLAGALYRFWLFRCHFGEGEAWLSRALALPNAVTRTAERARCLYALGNLMAAHGSGEIADAEAANREALTIWRELGNAAEEGWTLFALGHEASLQADYETARTLLEESVAVAHAAGQAQAEINAIWKLGDLAFDAGDDAKAQLRAEAMLALATDTGWSTGVDNAHRLLGRLSLSTGEYASARLHLEAALAVSRAMGWSIGSAQTLVCLGQLAIELGDL